MPSSHRQPTGFCWGAPHLRRSLWMTCFTAPVLFARDWGFSLDEVKVPVRWGHGDHDHIIPFSHGEHVVSRLPDAEPLHLPEESHLAGLGRGGEILATLMKIWEDQP